MPFNFVYDPQRQGYDSTLWKTLSGTPSISSSSIQLNNASILHYADTFRGYFSFKTTVPVAPVAGQDKKIGLISLANDIYAYFQITGAVLQCVVKDEAGTSVTIPVAWDAAWTNTAKDFDIDWTGNNVKFKIGGVQVAYTEICPKSPMSMYIVNATADNMLIGYAEGRAIESYL